MRKYAITRTISTFTYDVKYYNPETDEVCNTTLVTSKKALKKSEAVKLAELPDNTLVMNLTLTATDNAQYGVTLEAFLKVAEKIN